MKSLAKISATIDAINNWIGEKVSWLSVFLILLVCLDVLRRKLFNQTEAWITELECFFFAMIFLLGAGFTFLHDRHVRVDVAYAKFSPVEKAWANITGIVLLLFPWLTLIFYWSIHYAWQSFLIREGSPNPDGLPALYLMKFAIPISLFLIFLQGVSELIKSINTIQTSKRLAEKS